MDIREAIKRVKDGYQPSPGSILSMVVEAAETSAPERRIGPSERRRVNVEGYTNRRIADNSRGRRKTDHTCWECLPLASPPMSEEEKRAQRAVAAIPGAMFQAVCENDGYIMISNHDYGMSKEICSTINDLLDRAELAEQRLAEEKACRQIVTDSHDLIAKERSGWEKRALGAEEKLTEIVARREIIRKQVDKAVQILQNCEI